MGWVIFFVKYRNLKEQAHLHSIGIVHRDVRCVNILVTDELDIKLADFGVSLWVDSNKETKKKPFYRGDKGVYEVKDTEESYTRGFDVRLFGIVLTKLMLFGDSVERDLYDWRNNTVIALDCDKPSFRSISLYEFGSLEGVNFIENVNEEELINELKKGNNQEQQEALLKIATLKTKGNPIIVQLAEYLAETGEDITLQRHAIAALATLEPSDMYDRIALIRDIASSSSEKGIKGYDVTKLLEIKKKTILASEVIVIMGQLAKCDWKNDSRIKDHIFKGADTQYGGLQWDERCAAAEAIRFMPFRDEETLTKLLDIFAKEGHPRPKAEFITTFGCLKWSHPKIIALLTDVFQNESNGNIRRRALRSLGSITKVDDSLRKSAIEFLCKDLDMIPAGERRIVAEAIGLLATPDDLEVGEVILKLLEDENEGVKREAGKALSILNR